MLEYGSMGEDFFLNDLYTNACVWIVYLVLLLDYEKQKLKFQIQYKKQMGCWSQTSVCFAKSFKISAIASYQNFLIVLHVVVFLLFL